MLRSLKDFEGYTVSATDGDIGSVESFLFDDERWAIRYLIAETGDFFDRRRVLISPIAFRRIDAPTRHFHVALTMDKVKHSPDVDVDKPVSRQHESDYSQYYGYPSYWGYLGLWGMGTYPGVLAIAKATPAADAATASGDRHLRSVEEVRGYHIEGTDHEIGHIVDFIVDDMTWQLRYLVVNTSSWWFGKKVLISPQWATRVSWEESAVHLGLSRHMIKNSPAWDSEIPLTREYEARLFDYYGHPAYWPDPTPIERSPSPIKEGHRIP